MGPTESVELRVQVADYLRAHHTMTVATTGGEGNTPHAASVFYAVDDAFRLIFLSKTDSVHGLHIGAAAPVAVTVTEQYEDWEKIQGVQLWGQARLLKGTARAGAFLVYLRCFPFVHDMMRQPRHAQNLKDIGVYRVEPQRAAFTDNTAGVFGRNLLELMGE